MFKQNLLKRAKLHDKHAKHDIDEKQAYTDQYMKRIRTDQWERELNTVYKNPDKIDIVIDELKKFQKDRNYTPEDMKRILKPEKLQAASDMELYTTKRGKTTLVTPKMKESLLNSSLRATSQPMSPSHQHSPIAFNINESAAPRVIEALRSELSTPVQRNTPRTKTTPAHGYVNEEGNIYNANTQRWNKPKTFKKYQEK